jgi:hypothetical protein
VRWWLINPIMAEFITDARIAKRTHLPPPLQMNQRKTKNFQREQRLGGYIVQIADTNILTHKGGRS